MSASLADRVDECINAASGAGNAFKLAFAQTFFLQVDELELHATFLEVALCLFGVETFLGAEDLDVHVRAFSVEQVLLLRI